MLNSTASIQARSPVKGRVAGGSRTRKKIAGILGILPAASPDSPITLAAIALNRRCIEIEILCGKTSSCLVLQPAGQGENGFLNTGFIRIYYRGKTIPKALERHLKTKALVNLAPYSFEDLCRIFMDDPDLGSPVEKMPLPHDLGEENFKKKALLSSWGSDASWHTFLAVAEISRCQLDSLDFFKTCRFIQHSDSECIHVTPQLGVPMMEMVHYPWKNRLRDLNRMPAHLPRVRKKANASNMFMTDLTEYDVIMGQSNDKLICALEAATATPHDSFILCSNTCVPIVAGEDVASIVARYQEKSTTPILFLTCTADSMETLFHRILVTDKARAFQKTDRNGLSGRINLVGYAVRNDFHEISRILEAAGIVLNTAIIPHLTLKTVAAYPRAELDVIYPNTLWTHLYDQLAQDSPIRTISPPPPYGMAAGREWLGAVLSAARIEADADALWQEAARPFEGQLERLHEAARQHAICFVADGEETFRLIDPGNTWGIPLLPLVEELGFGIHVYLHATNRKTAFRSATEVNAVFRFPERHVIKAFNTPDRLTDLLASEDTQAVYSDYVFDWRIVRAGKAQISMQAFEMGPAGAVRTAERLLSTCRLPFFRRYAKYFGNAYDACGRWKMPAGDAAFHPQAQ